MTKAGLPLILGLFALCFADTASAQDVPPTADVMIRSGSATIAGTQYRCNVSVISNAAASGVVVTMALPPFMTVVSGICTPKNIVSGFAECMIGDMAANQLETAVAIGRLDTPLVAAPSCAVFVSSSTPDPNPANNFKVNTPPAPR